MPLPLPPLPLPPLPRPLPRNPYPRKPLPSLGLGGLMSSLQFLLSEPKSKKITFKKAMKISRLQNCFQHIILYLNVNEISKQVDHHLYSTSVKFTCLHFFQFNITFIADKPLLLPPIFIIIAIILYHKHCFCADDLSLITIKIPQFITFDHTDLLKPKPRIKKIR